MVRLIAVVFCVLCSLVFAESMTGRCVSVADGDTFTLLVEGNRQESIRLWGIDSSEGGQDFGRASKKALRSLIHNRELRVDVTGQNRYGRTIGKVYLGSDYINLRMVRSGYAWHFLKSAPNDDDLAAAEQAAWKDRAGLWHRNLPSFRGTGARANEQKRHRKPQMAVLGFLVPARCITRLAGTLAAPTRGILPIHRRE